jgi:acetyl-CoA carboxylase biotin carboxyl carrier protein
MINFELLRRLIKEVESSGIDTVEISRWGWRIRITKSPGVVAPPAPGTLTIPVGPAAAPGHNAGNAPGALAAPPAAPAVPAPPAPAAPAPPAPPPAPAAPEPRAKPLHEVVSPMVGTFYRAPAPDAPPYVEVGQRVMKGQTLCILEAMKLMNELQSEVDGVVREICVQNGEPVEYGQVLFRIELE